jgi:MFS family permease
MGSLLREAPAFRALWSSRAVSQVGDGVSRVALVLLVADRGPSAVGLALLAATLPRLLGPLAGAVVDRADPRRLLRTSELTAGAAIVTIALARPATPLLLVLVAIAAAAAATCTSTAGRSALPTLVPRERVGEATAWLGTALNLQVLLGGAAGGALVAGLGVRAALLVDAGTFAASVLLLRNLPRLPPAPGERARLLADTAAGLRFGRRDPAVRALALGTLALVTFLSLGNVALVFLVRDTLGAPGAAIGAAQTIYGIGMVTGSLAMLGRGRGHPGRWLLLGAFAGAVGTATTGLAPALALALAGQLLAGAGNAIDVVASDILVQHVVPRELLGRVFGLIGTCAQLGAALAYSAGGPLLTATSPRTVYLIAGAGSLAALPLLAPALRAARP